MGAIFRVDHGSKQSSPSLGINSTGVDYLLTVESSPSGSKAETKRIDNGTVLSSGVTRDGAFVETPGPIAILTIVDYDDAGNVSQYNSNKMKGRFYWFRAYGWDGDLKCDIVPVKDTKGASADT